MKKSDFDLVIPMDGDGEDRPEELGPLLIVKLMNIQIKLLQLIELKDLKDLYLNFVYLAT